MDGDHSAKTLDSGANSAIKTQDLTDSIHETAHQGAAAGDKATGHGTSVFDKSGAIGKQFTTEGTIGGTAQKIGGPLDAQGAIGKHFNADGSLGGTAQSLAEKNQQH